MTTKQPDFAEINALAIEACDMWQEHLSSFANDPNARAELTRFLEPQRRLFADWAAMMQQGANHAQSHAAGHEDQRKPQPAADAGGAATEPAAAPKPAAPGGTAHGDDPLRTAQLALRVAELEKRIAQLEGLIDAGGTKSAGAPRRTQRAAS